MDPVLLQAIRDWGAQDPDPETKAELDAIARLAVQGDAAAQAELRDAFDGTLQFGTAGLRGAMGPGPNRMNRAVVTRAAAGLAAYLVAGGHAGKSVVIGFDARHKSDQFARDTAEVMAGAGLVPLVLPRALPTPVLAFAIRQLGACAGVMVTASHNPPQDNGYKVYLGDGCQIVPPADAGIAAQIALVGDISELPRAQEWNTLGEEVVEDYVARAAASLGRGGNAGRGDNAGAPDGRGDLRYVYSAMHGVGGPVFVAAATQAGFAPPIVVEQQFTADPDFPTVSFPNPEEPGAMDLALESAAAESADLVIAHDPDADRCAVAVPGADGSWRMLSGDETGWILAHWMLESARRQGRTLEGSTACSIVSSSLLARIAAAGGLTHHETLTGFKWIARAAEDLRFGYEEALGYCVDPDGVRDKDGITAALRVLECAAAMKSEGESLQGILDDIAARFGVHRTSQVSVRVSDLSRIATIMEGLRASTPQSLGGLQVSGVDDLARGDGGLPPTDGMRFRLGGGDLDSREAVQSARVIIRPSGTEPKVKAYVEVIADSAAGVDIAREQADAVRSRIEEDVRTLFA